MLGSEPHIEVKNLTMAYGEFLIQRDLTFTINRGDIFIIMGGSGCGKSTLLKHLIGLKEPASGSVLYEGVSYWDADADERAAIMRRCGVMYQYGAMWSSRTLAENITMLLEEYSQYSKSEMRDIAALKLSLVGLSGFEDYYPSEISGGMLKRAALARALALDPEILFFDEPSAGLDPISSRNLDELILQMREALGTTIVVVTHELASIFTIGNNSVFLDPVSKTMIAQGDPKILLQESEDPRVHTFLTRGSSEDIGRGGQL